MAFEPRGSSVVAIVVTLVTLASAGSGFSQSTQAPRCMELIPQARATSTGTDHEFVGIPAGAVGPDGSIFVVASRVMEIRQFRPDGRHVRTFGGRGQGPGEFQLITAIGFVGDTLYVIDERLGRVTFLATDGNSLYSIPFPVPSFPDSAASVRFSPARPRAVLKDGSVIVRLDQRREASTRGAAAKALYLRVARTGRVLDTIAAVSLRASEAVLSSGAVIAKSAVSDFPLSALLPQDLQVAVLDRPSFDSGDPSTAAYRLTLIRESNDTVLDRRYAYSPVEVPDSVRNRLTLTQTRVARAGGVSPAEIQRAQSIPRFWPPVQDLVVGADRSMWLRRENQGFETRWTVLRDNGDVFATAFVRANTQLLVASASGGWGVESTPDGTPLLVRYGVQSGLKPCGQ
jgi:hypothetical protein